MKHRYVILSLLVALGMISFGVMDFMLPSAWALCLDVGKNYAGTISGAMNTAGNLGGFLCSLLFGYIVEWFDGNYNAPPADDSGNVGHLVFALP